MHTHFKPWEYIQRLHKIGLILKGICCRSATCKNQGTLKKSVYLRSLLCTPAFTYTYVTKVFAGPEMEEKFYDSETLCIYVCVCVDSKSHRLLVSESKNIYYVFMTGLESRPKIYF